MIVSLLLSAWASPELPLRPPTVGARQLLRAMPPAGRARSKQVADALLAGHIPLADRHLTPIQFTRADRDGVEHQLTIWVTRDYLALGTNADQVYAPLDLPQARRVARELGMILPTPLLSDLVHGAASMLTPQPIPPDEQMATTGRLLEHQALLERQGIHGVGLLAGHKKDLVLTAKLSAQPDRVAIYGWHRTSGRPIQPVSLWHGEHYVDYSHGVRLVARSLDLDGQTRDVLDVLADPALAPLLSEEGALPVTLLAQWR